MNTYAILILIILVIHYWIGIFADLLNLKALSPELPAEFADVYDQEEYRRSQEYTRARTRFGFIEGGFDFWVLLFFWFVGGFELLDICARSWQVNPELTGVGYIALLVAGKSLLSLPFTLYSTFVIEERFGFNRTTVATFFMDRVKGFLLAVVLGGPLLYLILLIFNSLGPGAWLLCWLVLALFILGVQFIVPTWIMPLFNTFTPLEDGDLRRAILQYAGKVNFPLENIFVMDGSRRSSKGNAFFSGFGKKRRIALFDTLIESHSVSELVAVLAHEIGHYKMRHILQGVLLSIVHSGFLLYLFSLFISKQELFAAFFVTTPSVYGGLIFFSLLFTPVDLVLSIAINGLSRKNEFSADRFARETTGTGEYLVSALKKLSSQNLANITPAPLYVALHYSHPPLRERVRALS